MKGGLVSYFQFSRFELAAPQPLFTFNHPNWEKIIDNTRYIKKTFSPLNTQNNISSTRYAELSFTAVADSVLHGFGGYFECKLYKEIMISILPATHSPGMFSWFPILFPLREPVQLKMDDEIVLHFWRNVSTKHVWYEWALSSPTTVAVHNPNGRSYEIGL